MLQHEARVGLRRKLPAAKDVALGDVEGMCVLYPIGGHTVDLHVDVERVTVGDKREMRDRTDEDSTTRHPFEILARDAGRAQRERIAQDAVDPHADHDVRELRLGLVVEPDLNGFADLHRPVGASNIDVRKTNPAIALSVRPLAERGSLALSELRVVPAK